MNEPELKFEIDEHGRIGYRVTNEGVLLSKEEKELIISDFLRMQEENARLHELVWDMLRWMPCNRPCRRCERYHYPDGCEFELRMRKIRTEEDS